jgi:hypothetical protein
MLDCRKTSDLCTKRVTDHNHWSAAPGTAVTPSATSCGKPGELERVIKG